MPWTPYVDYSGQQWAVNRDALYSLIRAKVHAETVLRRTRPTYGKLFGISDVYQNLKVNKIETNWTGFRQELDQKSSAEFLELEEVISRAVGENMVARISDVRADTRTAVKRTADLQRRFCGSVMGLLHQEQVAMGVMVSGLKILRDGSAAAAVVISGGAFAVALAGGTVMAGGVITGVSAGAAGGLLAVGSAAKGVAEWTETGSVGSGILEATGNAVVGLVGFGAEGVGAGEAVKATGEALKKSAKTTVIVLGSTYDAVTEGFKAMAAGESVTVAKKRALARFGTSLATGIAGECERVPLLGKVTANWGADRMVGLFKEGEEGALLPSADIREPLGGHARFVNIPKVGARRPPPFVKGVITYAAELSSSMTDEDFVRAAILKRIR